MNLNKNILSGNLTLRPQKHFLISLIYPNHFYQYYIISFICAIRASNTVWNFTLAMVKAGLKDPTGNSLFSPVSILTTLNMLLLGTKGDTKNEIMTALGLL